METGFLNPIHDEEHFSSSYYNQGNGLDSTEMALFGEMIVPEIIDYDNLWQSVDDTGGSGQGEEQSTTNSCDFQKILFEWQHQLTYMQEAEAIKQIVPLGTESPHEVSDMFPNSSIASSATTDPTIDELFPPEINKDIPVVECNEETREEMLVSPEENVAVTQIKTEPEELNFLTKESSSNQEEEVKTAAIKIKQEKEITPVERKSDREEPMVDVETVGGEVPLLLAGDLTSLLEQFEATEKVNNVAQQPPSPPRPSNQTIRDALPAEVINRIKATRENHKKMISVIPAMPNKKLGKAATRMQDAGATLSRNKLLKLVTGGAGGESIQLDHDYCTSGDSTSSSSRSFYTSDGSEYPSQSSTPDNTRLPQLRATDNSSRKDSGLESGENSDEEVMSPVKVKNNKVILKTSTGLKSINVVTDNNIVISSSGSVIPNNVPMVSVLKKNQIKVEKEDSSSAVSVIRECSSTTVQSDDKLCIKSEVVNTEVVNAEVVNPEVAGKKKKKKLNLEEYRVRREERERIRSQESSRASSPVGQSCTSPPVQPDSTTATTQEGVRKEKPLMLSVEVQTQTCDFIDLTASSKSPKEQEKSRTDRKEKRNDLKHRSYRSRRASSSSSSSSADSDHHHSRSHRRKRSSRRRSRHHRSSVSRMWSRSPSPASSAHSLTSSRSRSRSRDRRQKWRSRSPRRNSRYENSKSFHRDRSWQRGRSPVRIARNQDFAAQEKVRQVEERRVIYVGRIEEGTTKADLRKRFQQFGPIIDISVHFRERGDNYGFVTFAYKTDAYNAVEHGNDDPKQPRYDLCFGGRRAFCKQRYADLDGLATTVHDQYGPPMMQQRSNDSFDLLLNQLKAEMRKRSSV